MSLRDEVRASIQQGLQAAARLQSGTTTEVDVLFGLFTTSIDELDRRVGALMRPLGLRCYVSGIFCHQSPMLSFEGRPSVELGDLLIAYRYSGPNQSFNNAFLLQTKCSEKPVYTPGEQLDLYTKWPKFTWKKTGEARRVSPRAHRGAQYGFIDVCEKGCPSCSITTAVAPSTAGTDLADELVDVIMGASGRPFKDYDQAKRGRNWDRVIWDLLIDTVRRADFAHARADELRRNRSSSAARAFLAEAGVSIRSLARPLPLLLTQSGAPYPKSLEQAWFYPAEEYAEVPPEIPEEPSATLDLPDDNAISTIFVDVAPTGHFD
jgi:hypothetical protein